MRKIKDYTWHDQKKIEFELDDSDGGYNNYEAFVDYWFVSEPAWNDYPGCKYIDEIYINALIKDGDEVHFVKQSDIKDEVKNKIVSLLEETI